MKRMILLFFVLCLSQSAFSKILFCESKSDLDIGGGETESLIDIHLKLRKDTSDQRLERPVKGRATVLNSTLGVVKVTNGKCFDLMGYNYYVHYIGGGLGLETSSGVFNISCPLVSNKRFGPVGDVASFAGVVATAKTGVGVTGGAFINKAFGICTLIGVDIGLGASATAGGLYIRNIPNHDNLTKEAAALLNLTDEDLLSEFKRGVGLYKLIEATVTETQQRRRGEKIETNEIGEIHFRPEYRNDRKDMVKRSAILSLRECDEPLLRTKDITREWRITSNPIGYFENADIITGLRSLVQRGCIL